MSQQGQNSPQNVSPGQNVPSTQPSSPNAPVSTNIPASPPSLPATQSVPSVQQPPAVPPPLGGVVVSTASQQLPSDEDNEELSEDDIVYANFPYIPPPEPQSEWGRRFGAFCSDAHLKPAVTWLDPAYPTVDPISLRPNFLPNDYSFPMPSCREIDVLFSSESIQRSFNTGLTTWEIALLQTLTTPVGQDPTSKQIARWQASPIVVDESQWLNTFKKSRWVNCTEKIYDYEPGCIAMGLTPTDTFSVDNPIVWRELSPCIELANRFLKLSFHGRWYDPSPNTPRNDKSSLPTSDVEPPPTDICTREI
jgi:hypothetical protein